MQAKKYKSVFAEHIRYPIGRDPVDACSPAQITEGIRAYTRGCTNNSYIEQGEGQSEAQTS
jgi:hypothetical protein